MRKIIVISIAATGVAAIAAGAFFTIRAITRKKPKCDCEQLTVEDYIGEQKE